MTTITALPTPPSRDDPANFAARGDDFLGALPTFVTECNTVAGEVNTNATNAATSASSAATSASTATTQASTATTQADAAAASAATALAAPGTNATSTTSLAVGTGAKSLTIQTGKSLVVGMEVVIAYTTTPTTRMVGTITAYNSGTGALDVNVTSTSGSGTQAAWTVSLTAAQGDAITGKSINNSPIGATTPSTGKFTTLEAASLLLTGPSGEPLTINGNFGVNQRAATSVGDDAYCFDRFYVLTESGNVTIGSLTDPEAGAPWGIRLTQPDASPKRIGLATIIESKDCRWLRSATAALAARVKLSTGATLRYAILEHTGTVDTVTSDVVNNWASSTFTPSNFFIAGLNVLQCGTVAPGAATWGDIANYGAVGAAMNNLIGFVWTESAVAQNVTLDFSRFDLLPGAVQLPRIFRKHEQMLCQRYLPSFRASSTNANIAVGAASNATDAYVPFDFKVTPMTPPTGLVVSAAAHFGCTNAAFSATNACSSVTLSSASPHTAMLICVASGLASGDATWFRATSASGQLLFTGAEL